MSSLAFMTAPIIVFLVVVAPIWLILHYRSKNQAARSLSADEQSTLDQLMRISEKMDARLTALEKILENEDPNWKEKT